MNADLLYALQHARRTTANVTSLKQEEAAIYEATDYWISSHRTVEWHLACTGLTLLTELTSANEGMHLYARNLGILQRYHLEGWDRPNTLWIYSSDKYTETWVHELIIERTRYPGSRILNIERNDKDDLIDLGSFDFKNLKSP